MVGIFLRGDLRRPSGTVGVAVCEGAHLAQVARDEGRLEEAALAEKIMVHAQMEEQVTYPAAVLVGEVVRMRLEE